MTRYRGIFGNLKMGSSYPPSLLPNPSPKFRFLFIYSKASREEVFAETRNLTPF